MKKIMYSNTIVMTSLLLLVTLFSAVANAQSNRNISKTASNLSQTENDIVKVWVFFNNKNTGSVHLSKKSVLRRSAVNFVTDIDDAPVNDEYIEEIVKKGAVLENVYKWGNAASFSVQVSVLPVISHLSFVKSLRPVGIYSKKTLPDELLKKKAQSTLSTFQHQKMQLDMLNIPQAHYYLNRKSAGNKPGEGVLVGFFDSGFRLDHTCFAHLKSSGRIKAQHDFVDGDNDPQDSDSSLNHGSTVLAQVAGYEPGIFIGSAWGVDVALARTEISEKEIHTEEDNWVAALVWAESLGVDIVSSSVGYATDFEDSVLIGNDYFTDYPYSSLDGHSTIISHAASLAVKRGMVIVNSIGNEGHDIVGTLNAPADVDGVIAVGAIDKKGYLSSFSSIGPTWDGRIKPDCVAPGEGIVVPVFNPPGSYSTGFTGTSYSTPLVSGIIALIIQSSKEKITSTILVQKLLNNCHFSPGQDTIDNRYGYGIPDALLSVMDNKDVLIYVTDSSGIPVAGAEVCNNDRYRVGITDSLGILLYSPQSNTSLKVFSSRDSVLFTIEKLPFYKHIVLNTVSTLDIKIVDKEGRPVPGCGIIITTMHDNTNWQLKTDGRGVSRFVYGQSGDIGIAISASGYYSPPAIGATLTGRDDSIIITLTKIPENSLILFPTLLKKNDELVTLLFSGAVETSGSDVIASIYSVSGKLIWTESKKSQFNEPVIFKWYYKKNCFLTPGAYYATIKFDKKLYKKKMLIAG
jgi:subtilisin family serine protease